MNRPDKKKPLFFRDLLFTVSKTITIWLVVGMPVALAVSAIQLFLWVVLIAPEVARAAAIFGAIHGLWLHLAGQSHRSTARDIRLFGIVSGGILGLLGFPVVFSRADILPVTVSAVVTFVMAATLGGAIAGGMSATFVAIPQRHSSSTLVRNVALGCLLVLPILAIEYRFFWTGTVERLPILDVPQRAIAKLSSGDARGSSHIGCYRYWGRTPMNLGGRRGQLRVHQSNGTLRVDVDDEKVSLSGGVDGDGRFLFGGERTSAKDTLPEIWNGTFQSYALTFTRRSTLLGQGLIVHTDELTGAAKRATCLRPFDFWPPVPDPLGSSGQDR